MKKNKILSCAVLFTIVTSALFSCGSKEKELVIWAWNKNVDALNEGIKKYQEVNPKFKARVESFSRKDIDKKIKTSSQNGDKNNMADIILGDAMNMMTYYDLWSDLFLDFSSNVNDIEKSTFVQSTLDTVSLDNKLIGLPFGIGPTVVFANVNLWDQNTLNDVVENGWTWDDYKEIGLAIKETHGSDVCMTSYNLRNDDRMYRTMVSQKGEWFMDKEYNVFIGNENSVKAMTMVKDMHQSNVLGHIDTGDYKSLMKNNKIAAQIQGFFLGGQLKDVAPEMSGQWRVLPLPKWSVADETSASITGGSYLYANSKLEGEDKKNAIDFVKWMTLENESVIRTFNEAGIYPALKTSYDTDEFKNNKDPYFGNETVLRNVGNFSSSAKSIIGTKYNGYNYDKFVETQEKILFTEEYESVNAEMQKLKETILSNAK